MAVPRTYVSKIENEKATPTLSSLSGWRGRSKWACRTAFGWRTEPQEEVRELMEDQFVADLFAVCFAAKWDADVEHLTQCGT